MASPTSNGTKIDEPYVNAGRSGYPLLRTRDGAGWHAVRDGGQPEPFGRLAVPAAGRPGVHPGRQGDRPGVRRSSGRRRGWDGCTDGTIWTWTGTSGRFSEQGFAAHRRGRRGGPGRARRTPRRGGRDPARRTSTASGIDDSKLLTRAAARGCLRAGASRARLRSPSVRIEPTVIDARGLHRSNIALLRRCVPRARAGVRTTCSPTGSRCRGCPVPSLGIKKGDAVSGERRRGIDRGQGHARPG